MPPRLPVLLLRRQFSSTTRLRAEAESDSPEFKVSKQWEDRKDVKDMMQWLETEGRAFKRPAPAGGPNYLKRRNARRRDGRDSDNDARNAAALEAQDATDAALGKEMEIQDGESYMRKLASNQGLAQKKPQRPFELNPYFVSLPVLSEMLKETIYKYVAVDGHSVRSASEHFRVSVERVAAVVRMKQIERNWVKTGKRVVPRYSEQVMRMLPQTPYNEEKPRPHESINDLPVHRATTQQIFWPVSESRKFTREDAGRVFQPGLKSADLRIPHPEMVIKNQTEAETTRSMRMKKELEMARNQKTREKSEAISDEKTKTVLAGRWSFKIQDVDIDSTVGKEGRGRQGVGWRYGMPFDDRKRGVIKIPTSVP